MLKNLFFAAFFTLLCFSFSFAQTSKKSDETNWEILEVSGRRYNYTDASGISRYIRKLTYHTSGVSFDASDSLEWMKDSYWELISVYAIETESSSGYLFKRRYDKQRTEREIEWLKKEYEKIYSESKSVPQSDLVDLDLVEYKQKAIDLGKSEKTKYENLLKQINEFPLKVISVETTSYDPKESNVSAEIVLDATNVLVKDGKNYRSSEAEKYIQEVSKRILEKLNLYAFDNIKGNSWEISRGKIPKKIGDFKDFGGKIRLKISIVVNLNNREIIVSQGFISAYLKKDNQ